MSEGPACVNGTAKVRLDGAGKFRDALAMRLLFVLAPLLLAAAAANAQGLDRDTLLTDAPAVPAQGTVRLTGGVTGTSDTGGVGATQGQAQVSGSIQWTPLKNLAGDVGAYYQVGAQGPSARVR